MGKDVMWLPTSDDLVFKLLVFLATMPSPLLSRKRLSSSLVDGYLLFQSLGKKKMLELNNDTLALVAGAANGTRLLLPSILSV